MISWNCKNISVLSPNNVSGSTLRINIPVENQLEALIFDEHFTQDPSFSSLSSEYNRFQISNEYLVEDELINGYKKGNKVYSRSDDDQYLCYYRWSAYSYQSIALRNR